jgi:hypothetical protein
MRAGSSFKSIESNPTPPHESHPAPQLSSAQVRPDNCQPAQPVVSNTSHHLMREDHSSGYIHALQPLVYVWRVRVRTCTHVG